MSRIPSGRPLPGEFAAYAADDIAFVDGADGGAALAASSARLRQLLGPLAESAIHALRYAPGKWTLKEVVGHLIDDERIFAYRALAVARGDVRPLAGFDENKYVSSTNFEARPLAELLEEHAIVRRASIAFFESLTAGEWLRAGTVNDNRATVRGLAFHMAGHELHHLRVLESRYLGHS